jgi:hypothetical protein
MATALFFAPTYFAPTYFAALAPTAVPNPPAPAPPGSTAGYGDPDAYAAILAALRGTGAFGSVLFGVPPDQLALAGAAAPLASIVPEGWEDFDEVDPPSILRRGTFAVYLLARDDDPLARFGRMAKLDAASRAALDGSGLGGCLPALTRLRRSRPDPRSLHPEQVARIDGEFTYIVGPTTTTGANP